MKPFRVISFNANGIRAAARKGFFDWLKQADADVICLQETKAQQADLTKAMFYPEGYHCYYVSAEKKGYSGVAIYSREKPSQLITSLNYPEADQEGRYIAASYRNDLTVASLYLPSGTSGDIRQQFKYRFMDFYEPVLAEICKRNDPFIICGDWNIAHKKIDLKNWRSNQKNSGFLPEERAWLDKLIDQIGWVDAFRVVNQEPDQYTWWSQRSPTARANNVGWRIDYHMITPSLKNKVKQAEIYTKENFSDHAPLIIDYAL